MRRNVRRSLEEIFKPKCYLFIKQKPEAVNSFLNKDIFLTTKTFMESLFL